MFIQKKTNVEFAAQTISLESGSSSDEEDDDDGPEGGGGGGKQQVILVNHYITFYMKFQFQYNNQFFP